MANPDIDEIFEYPTGYIICLYECQHGSVSVIHMENSGDGCWKPDVVQTRQHWQGITVRTYIIADDGYPCGTFIP